MAKSQSEQVWQEELPAANFTYVRDSAEEKALVRKIDKRIVPTVWILYTLSYLDRANIGNAKVGGMEEDLALTSTQYSVCLLLFFVSYVIFEVPSNMILTRVRPSIFLSVLCFGWGAVAACMGAVNNWQQLAGVRFCLGVIEAGFAPGVAFYLSSWYKRHELAKRYSIYYTATAVSGAFSGLLAGVITDHLKMARGIEGWRWLFIIEGAGSCFLCIFTWYILPDWPSTTKWLSPEEKFIAVQRLAADGIGNTGTGNQPTHSEAAKMAFTDWRTWVLVFMYMLATGSQTIQYFIPTLVGQLGYTGYDKQYMTIPVYAVAFVFILLFCFTSDIRRERGNYITLGGLLAGVSFIITVAVNNEHVKYGFLCIAVGAVYAVCPLTLLWVSGIIDHPAEKRAVAIAIVNALGNSASIYGSFLWPASTGPRYVQGFATTTAFVLLLAIMAQVNKFLIRRYPGKRLEESFESGGVSREEKDIESV
ncbi:MFS general substrate transporter [Schizophyllum commune H4-8]|uniref:Major facilitator superfamily (MFS) profile domain-containing protein n=1 Tax=Schizophyllum commune (strain H4-8 / FGSC 9210) TaxID=578458 RepID=D8Q791_SCHCM|nr:MFS general substrate transporter [Schizophyllum commune H4-8]KAI5891591.1 MFS general substrate transporter [Schizophyllum commune H4-8]